MVVQLLPPPNVASASNLAPVEPFLKWPGGKRWIASRLAPLLAAHLTGRYFEPFLGSAAPFFALRPSDAILSDSNSALIATFRTVAESPDRVIAAVWRFSNSAECYYRVRRSRPRTEVGKAARFIYLNRTAWGGLYRINRKGEFNTPFGNTGRVICRSRPLFAASALLSQVGLHTADFESMIDLSAEGDVVYADPPYVSESSGHEAFIRYASDKFLWRDQIRLADAAQRAVSRGAKVFVSGRASFGVADLYLGWHRVPLERACNLSRRINGSRKFDEVLLVSPNVGSLNDIEAFLLSGG